jgi:ATP/maltotriose-dependent transcriptional regulator MalT
MPDAANLLATKRFIPPPTPTLVDRSRLIERLNTNVRRPLTLLSSPRRDTITAHRQSRGLSQGLEA